MAKALVTGNVVVSHKELGEGGKPFLFTYTSSVGSSSTVHALKAGHTGGRSSREGQWKTNEVGYYGGEGRR